MPIENAGARLRHLVVQLLQTVSTTMVQVPEVAMGMQLLKEHRQGHQNDDGINSMNFLFNSIFYRVYPRRSPISIDTIEIIFRITTRVMMIMLFESRADPIIITCTD